jgi:3-hydroxyacyl-[acyl-carrier-protein] dehydratase
MLLNDFYILNTLETINNRTTAIITINKNHNVFKGHFPGNPVTPGVCMMQIIKEITESVVEKKLFMTSTSNVKFMAIINPYITPELSLTIEVNPTEEGYKIKNVTKFSDTIAIKLSAIYKES